MRTQFIAGAHVVLEALRLPAVADAWEQPSVLAGQTVGSLCGHLARGSVWVVADYLERAASEPLTFESAVDYFTTVVGGLSEADHLAIRDRGAEVASMGHDALIAQAGERLAALEQRLPEEPADRIIAVYAGTTIRLDDYLVTRLVEQIVHLDDLARSVDATLPDMPRANTDTVLDIGSRLGVRRFGPSAMIGGMFRGLPGAFPVL